MSALDDKRKSTFGVQPVDMGEVETKRECPQ